MPKKVLLLQKLIVIHILPVSVQGREMLFDKLMN